MNADIPYLKCFVRGSYISDTDSLEEAYVLELADGNLCALPTNRIAFKDGYFVGAHPNPKAREYTVQEDSYHAETSAWDVSKDTRFFYSPQAGPVRTV